MDTRVYIVAHEPMDEYCQLEGYVPIQVGNREKFCEIRDNSGDNIAKKNEDYSEQTAMYYIWKNVKCDIVGICHYRRYFFKDNQFICKEEIEELLEIYDFIVGKSLYLAESNYAHWAKNAKGEAMLIAREVIAERYPEYLSSFDFCMPNEGLTMCNMLLCKKEKYNQYCKWLFAILGEVEKRGAENGYPDFNQRMMAYVGEALLRVFLVANHCKVREEKLFLVTESGVAEDGTWNVGGICYDSYFKRDDYSVHTELPLGMSGIRLSERVEDLLPLFVELEKEKVERILDIGGSLKERAVISRQLGEYEIPYQQILDVLSEEDFRKDLPIYNFVYTNLYSLASIGNQYYDKIMILTALKESEVYIQELITYCITHTKKLVVSSNYCYLIVKYVPQLMSACMYESREKNGKADYVIFDIITYLYNSIHLMIENQNHQEALEVLQTYEKVIYNEYDLLFVATGLAAALGEREIAEKFAKKALDIKPNEEEVLELLSF